MLFDKTGPSGRILLVISFGKEKSFQKPVFKEVNLTQNTLKVNLVLLFSKC